MTDSFHIRRAGLQDAAMIIRHRRRMFEDIGGYDPAKMDLMDREWAQWLPPRLASSEYLGWFACAGEAADAPVVAGAGLWLMHWIPGPDGSYGLRPYVLNVYTEPAYRGRGLARRLMETLIKHCRVHEYPTLTLHASEAGRPIYVALGFRQTNEMRLKLTPLEVSRQVV